ncbi:hypothetical protein IWX47DRAFT_434105 [Phyllosticta citricarpa]
MGRGGGGGGGGGAPEWLQSSPVCIASHSTPLHWLGARDRARDCLSVLSTTSSRTHPSIFLVVSPILLWLALHKGPRFCLLLKYKPLPRASSVLMPSLACHSYLPTYLPIDPPVHHPHAARVPPLVPVAAALVPVDKPPPPLPPSKKARRPVDLASLTTPFPGPITLSLLQDGSLISEASIHHGLLSC